VFMWGMFVITGYRGNEIQTVMT